MNKLMPTLFAMTIIIGFFLSSTVVSAASKTTTASVTVPEACTMTSHNNTPHTATLSPNTYSGASGSEYANGIGKTTLTATCNDDNGFAIYAIGYTGNSYDSENHNKLVGQSTNVAINTAVYTSGDTTSSWSMKVNKINDSTVSYNPQNMSILDSFDSWHIVPATYTKVAEYHANTGSSTTDTTLGAKVETTYAAYIASNQPADTYIGQVKYTMVHPYDNTPKDGPIADCPANKICYSPNANDIEGTMGQQPITSSATSTTLLASNFSRKGYGFAGWSDRYDYSNDNGAKFYGPQETISFTAGQYNTTNGGLRLYAIWVPSQGSLQDQSKVTSICNSLTTAPTDGTANLNSISALTDQRDNDTYAIAKLADGNCWMIENLRLESGFSRGDTNIALAQGYHESFVGLADPETKESFGTSSANSEYSIDGSNSTFEISGDWQTYRFPRYNNVNTIIRDIEPTDNNGSIFSYGNYYTWPAAIADTTHYSADTHMDSPTSICPRNWKLPIGKQSTAPKSFGALSTASGGPSNGASATNSYSSSVGTLTSKLMRQFPNNIIYSGYYNSSGPFTSRGSGGYYWSTAAYDYSRAWSEKVTSTEVQPGTLTAGKVNGSTIRCVME